MPRTLSRPLLALFVLILASLACGTPAVIENDNVSCKFNRNADSTAFYECTCKTDSSRPVIFISAINIQFYSQADLANSACGMAPPSAQSQIEATEPPTEADPTDEPASTDEAPTEAPLQPYLTGSVRACNLSDHYLNFAIADTAPTTDPAALLVTLNDQPLKCYIPSNNPGILTCTFAPQASFPAEVKVSIAGEEVNRFTFNGGICVYNDPSAPTEDPTEAPTEEPAPTEAPLPEG